MPIPILSFFKYSKFSRIPHFYLGGMSEVQGQHGPTELSATVETTCTVPSNIIVTSDV